MKYRVSKTVTHQKERKRKNREKKGKGWWEFRNANHRLLFRDSQTKDQIQG